jgi:hypothetical protein
MRRALLIALALLGLGVAAAPAAAKMEIAPEKTTLEILDGPGGVESRAGSHPDRVVLSFEVTQTPGAEEDPKNVAIDFPPGMSGNLRNFPVCPRSVFGEYALTNFATACPPESQLGQLEIIGLPTGHLPLYNVEPAPGELTVFGTFFAGASLIFQGHLRPADQGLSLQIENLPGISGRGLGDLNGIMLELWGVPGRHGTGGPLAPFLSLPSRCDGGSFAALIDANSWQLPDRLLSTTADDHQPFTNCASLPFTPTVGVALDNPRADAPTGAQVNLHLPQNEDPDGQASSQVRSTVVSLPEGVTVSPGAASGLGTCSDAQFAKGQESEPSCPPSSRVGSVGLSGPVLRKPAAGTLYLGEERPGDRFRLFASVSIPGSTVKFTGSLRPDPRTGQLSASLTDMPEVSFEDLSLRFDGGPGALLATPLSCGTASGSVKLTPYSGTAPVERSLAVAIAGADGGACGAAPFAPTFSGGGEDVRAGRGGAFAAAVRRRDGEQAPDRLNVTFPPGVSANLGSVPPCAAAAAAAGSCAAASRIGSAQAELGPGANPARLDGDVYLTGPYKGAPFGVALAFPGKVGPFDLGKVIVRGKLDMDTQSGQVSLATDSLPRLIEGVGVRFETLALQIDKPGFMRNPTSCAPTQMSASLTSWSGAVSKSTTPFRVGGCVGLPFAPRFAMSLEGKSELRRGGRPALGLSVRQPAGNANLDSATFALPGLLKFNASGLQAICARPAAEAGNCPKSSLVGSGKALTPLLKAPLTGPVHVVQPKGNKGTPDLWADLEGEGVEINLKVDTEEGHGHFSGGLADLPDIPLSSFHMGLLSGEHGLIELKQGLCRGHRPRRLSSPVGLEGQNGASLQTRVPLRAAARCGGR